LLLKVKSGHAPAFRNGTAGRVTGARKLVGSR
jgi:hypothetical protein